MIPRIPVIFLRRRFLNHRSSRSCLRAGLIGLALGVIPLQAADVLKSNFESSLPPSDNPWAGVNGAGHLSVIPGSQPVVNNEGKTVKTVFAPSVTVGDLNGDGLPDLVVGDPKGFFWFFANSGTATLPKFTFGEIMPIWLGANRDDSDWGEGGEDNVIPHIQLVDPTGNGKKPDLVVGNYAGKLFYLHNLGSASAPVFNTLPSTINQNMIKTRKDGLLWCNFLAPCLYDWYGNHNLALLMGDGSYSANSIFLFANKGTTDQPVYNEDFMTKIVPGMGREHLTPQVLDWNNDGKMDVITGDRLGHVTLFLNNSTDPKNPTFDQGTQIKIGGNDTFGEMTAVTVCDLTGNKMPNLIVSNNAGDISYALNTGKPGTPQFNTLQPILGKSPFPKILRPVGWGDYKDDNPSGLSGIPWASDRRVGIGKPFGVPYELLVTTNASVEPDFKPPPNTKFKNALRFYVYPNSNTYFQKTYYPVNDADFNETHAVGCQAHFAMKEDTTYRVSFWIRSNGNIQNLNYHIAADWGDDDDHYEHPSMGSSVSSSNGWSLIQESVQFTWQKSINRQKSPHAEANMSMWFDWKGQGNIYWDDITVTQDTGP